VGVGGLERVEFGEEGGSKAELGGGLLGREGGRERVSEWVGE
jgi:hypothetical protein